MLSLDNVIAFISGEKFNYMFENDILGNYSENSLGVLIGDF